ncbi:MAG: hypothetical protein A2162_10880 [Deltaproteobacteria bacterium RBG_13_52_11b]|nr:MAG: hypothetical protein A2162_10880 [Deltaproteobacteria bacterium RBG_13_52_11b]
MEPKRIFIILNSVFTLSISLVSLGIGYAGGVRGEGLLAVSIPLTFGVLVALGQLIPAGILLSSFVRAYFLPPKS